MHMSAFIFVTAPLPVNLTHTDVWSCRIYLQRGAWLCVYRPGRHTDAIRGTPQHMRWVNCTYRTYILMFPLPAVWFNQRHSVSCVPQALFPFNALDMVLSLGLGGGAKGIIYCLFSKANVQARHISFAEYIWLFKYDFFFSFVSFFTFLCFTLRTEMLSRIWFMAWTEDFLVIITSDSWNRGEELMLWQRTDLQVRSPPGTSMHIE